MTSRKLVLAIWLFFIALGSGGKLRAAEEGQFVTIVNPVRISAYTPNVAESVGAEYGVVARYGLPATWLLTYDVMREEDFRAVAEKMDERQEMGAFLEVTPALAEAAGVTFHKGESWHHSNSIFLLGYTQQERKRLIDRIFEEFKTRWGDYPSSVGSWWTDSFSLDYMRQKYGVKVVLGLADQFMTDSYQVWGEYWSMPFYPSKYHAGVPAVDEGSKLDMVVLEWAPRDPLNGYGSSLYSTQDYKSVGLETDYFEKLVRLYLRRGSNEFGQVTVGLEGDLSVGAYEGEFARQMEVVANLAGEGEVRATNMQEFGEWYREKFSKLSPVGWIETDDLLGEKMKVAWYQSPRYRIGLVYDEERKEVKILDLRTYHANLEEPFYQAVNGYRDLFIDIPAVIDSKGKLGQDWRMSLGEWKGTEASNGEAVVRFEKGEIKLTKDEFEIKGITELPKVVTDSKVLVVQKEEGGFKFQSVKEWWVGQDGLIFRDWGLRVPYAIRLRLGGWSNQKGVALGVAGLVLLGGVAGWIVMKKWGVKGILLGGGLILILVGGWVFINSGPFMVSQAEADGLSYLASLPGGKVMVYDKDCRRCLWETRYQPAALANKRDYVGRLSGDPLVYDASLLSAKDGARGRRIMQDLGVRYLYLVKYEGYIEDTHFSPDDLGIEKIYETANSEIWRVR